MTAEEIIAAGKEALERNQGVDVVYLHETSGGPPIAAVVTTSWLRFVTMGQKAGVREGAEMLSHDHIEPGMF